MNLETPGDSVAYFAPQWALLRPAPPSRARRHRNPHADGVGAVARGSHAARHVYNEAHSFRIRCRSASGSGVDSVPQPHPFLAGSGSAPSPDMKELPSLRALFDF